MQANNILIYRNPFSSLMVLTALLLVTLYHTLTIWGESVAWVLSPRILVMKLSAHMYLKHLQCHHYVLRLVNLESLFLYLQPISLEMDLQIKFSKVKDTV